MESAAAHNTLYLNNINEKVKKNVLKQLLYMLFSQYGKVIQIVACKGIKMRGQVRSMLYMSIPRQDPFPFSLFMLLFQY